MQSKLICEEFDRKMWQFIDSDLPDEEMLFWKEHLHNCALCSTQLLEAGEALSIYESIPMEDLEEEAFERMVNKAVKNKGYRMAAHKLLDPVHELFSDGFIKKFAFGGLAFALAALVLFFMYKPVGPEPGKKLLKLESPGYASENRSTAENKLISSISAGTQKKSEVSAAKYDWKDKSTSRSIRHLGTSVAGIGLKKRGYLKLDSWALQAIALRRRMEWMRTDLDKSAM